MSGADIFKVRIFHDQPQQIQWLIKALEQSDVRIESVSSMIRPETFRVFPPDGDNHILFLAGAFASPETLEKLHASRAKSRVVVVHDPDNRLDQSMYDTRGVTAFLDARKRDPDSLAAVLKSVMQPGKKNERVQSESLDYEGIFEETPTPLLVFDKETFAVIRMNRAANVFYDRPHEAGTHITITGLTDPVFLEVNRKDITDQLQSGKRLLQQEHRVGNNALRYVDIHVSDITGDRGGTRLAMITDVTEVRSAMQQLLQSEMQLRTLARNDPNGAVFIIDRDYRILLAEGNGLQHGNHNRSGLLGQPLTVFPALTELEHRKKLLKEIFSGVPMVLETVVGERTYQVSGTGIRNAEGTIDRAIIVINDITFTISATRELRFQASILSTVMDAIIVKDLNGKILYWNDGASRMFGYEPDEIMGKQIGLILSRDHSDAVFFVIKETILKKGKITIEREAFRKGGERLVMESQQSVMPDAEGNPEFIVCVSRDVTQRVEAEKILKESEANLRAIFQSTSQSFMLMDTEYRIMAFNNNASESFQRFYNIRVLPGDYFTDYLLPNRLQPFRSSMEEVMKKKTIRYEERFDFPEESDVYLEVTYSPVITDDTVIGIILCVENTTEKIRAKNTVFHSEQKYRRLVETAIDLIWTVNPEGEIVFVNKASRSILGIEPEELIGNSFVDFVVDQDRERVRNHLNSAMQAPDGYSNFECRVRHRNGHEIYLLTNAVFQIDDTSRFGPVLLTCTSRDITSRVLAEKELNEKNEQLRMLSAYLQTVREEERTHIAREIHDELGQQLTGLKMDLAWISRKTGDSNQEVRKILAGALQLVDDTIRNVRKISSDLRPGILDDLGLVAAIEWYCIEFRKKTGITFTLDTNVQEVPIDKDSATGVFRIFQESLTNIARHSLATAIRVQFYRVTAGYRLRISDNGKGFNTGASEGKQKTLGLLGMQERAGMLKGDFSINSIPGKGTEIELTFPETITETTERK